MVYQRFLRKFAVDYQDCVEVMRQASLQESSRLAHKLLGAASNLALDDVVRVAAEIDQLSHDGQSPSVKLDVLDQAMKVALQSIALYAYPQTARAPQSAEVFSPQKLTELLAAALKSLAQDSPAGVEPILLNLDKHLSLEQLLPLRAALDNFDFRGAEACVHGLAEKLGICLVENSL
jgi:HPt (histidine-containing phosphotransfer) domain-containing protein